MHASTIETTTMKVPPLRVARPSRRTKLLSSVEMQALWEVYQHRKSEWRRASNTEHQARTKAYKLFPSYPAEAELAKTKYSRGKPVVGEGGLYQTEMKPATLYDLRKALADQKRLMPFPAAIERLEVKIKAMVEWERKVATIRRRAGIPALAKATEMAEVAYTDALAAVVKARTASLEGLRFKLMILAELEGLVERRKENPRSLHARIVLDSIRDLGAVVGIPTSRATTRH